MKIKEYRVFVVENPPPHYGGAYWTFVKLITDSKIEGIKEVYSLPFHPRVVEKMISDICERYVLGHDPFQIEQLWRRVYSSGYSQRSDLSLMGILSGIETACWDINGKALEKPVYELLGGLVHPKLRTYTYLYPDHNDEDRLYNRIITMRIASITSPKQTKNGTSIMILTLLQKLLPNMPTRVLLH